MKEKQKNFLNQTRSCNGGMGKNVFILRVRKLDPKDVKWFSLGHTVNDNSKIRILSTLTSSVELAAQSGIEERSSSEQQTKSLHHGILWPLARLLQRLIQPKAK